MNIDLILAENRTIFSNRLHLRPIELNDAKDVFEYAGNPSTTKFVSFQTHASVEDTKSNIASYFMKSPLGKYGICIGDTNKVIGAIDLRIDENEDKAAEIGFILNEKYHGNGYMTEAAQRVIKLAFETLQLKEIFALSRKENAKSIAVMNRLGMEMIESGTHMYYFKLVK